MKVTWGLENAKHVPNTIATLGSYDGVHLGHRKLLELLVRRKKELECERAVILTFHPHPQQVLRRNNTSVDLLTTIEERIELFRQFEVDEVIVIEFTLEFSKTSYIDFFRNVIVDQLGTRAMIVGFNHAFGKNREGDAEHLKLLAPTLGVKVEEVQPLILNDVSVSSTKIRHALLEGNIAFANTLLGRPYNFSGNVMRGDQVGRILGYPTANLEVDPDKLIPKDGIYAARVTHEGKIMPGALSIGTRPTVDDRGVRSIEVFVLDFDGNLYDQNLTIECLSYLRSQEKFQDLEELKIQIGNDVKQVRSLLA